MHTLRAALCRLRDQVRSRTLSIEETVVSGGELLLIGLAILIPLVLAIAVTLWTLQPAVRRAERARRARPRKRPPSPTSPTTNDADESISGSG